MGSSVSGRAGNPRSSADFPSAIRPRAKTLIAEARSRRKPPGLRLPRLGRGALAGEAIGQAIPGGYRFFEGALKPEGQPALAVNLIRVKKKPRVRVDPGPVLQDELRKDVIAVWIVDLVP